MRSQGSNEMNSSPKSTVEIVQNDDEKDFRPRIDAYCTLRSSSRSDNSIGKLSKTDQSKFYTINRKLKNFIKSKAPSSSHLLDDTASQPYAKLNESGEEFGSFSTATTSISSALNFGLSKDLSTESIKNVCDCFELSEGDDDGGGGGDEDKNLEGCQHQPHITNTTTTTTNQAINKTLFNKIQTELNDNLKRSSPLRFSMLDRRKKQDHFHPYCTIRRHKTDKDGDGEDPIDSNVNDNDVNEEDNDNDKAMIEKYDGASSMTSTEAFNILSELDAILNNHSTMTESPSSTTSSLSLSSRVRITSPIPSYFPSSSPTIPSNGHHIDDEDCCSSNGEQSMEKIEDCLLELDAYLEEIDVDQDDYDENIVDDQFDDEKSIKLKNNSLTLGRGRSFQRSRTLPKKSSQKKVSSEVNGSTKPFKRSHHFRNTVGGIGIDPRLKAQTRSPITASAVDQGVNYLPVDCVKARSSMSCPKTWRRRSMRKTALLNLPDQKENAAIVEKSIDPTSQLLHDDLVPVEGIQNENNSNSLNQQLNDPLTLSANHEVITIPSNAERASFTNEGFQQETEEVTLSLGRSSVANTTRRCISQEDCTNRQNLTHLDIIHDILRNSTQDGIQGRPRQLGRRADQHPRIVSIMAETNSSGNQRIIVNHDRPSSAPAAASSLNRNSSVNSPLASSDCSRYIGSEPSSVGSSRNPSPVSLLSSTGSSSTASAGPDQTPESRTQRTSPPEPSSNHINISRRLGNNSQWPHGFSRILTLLCCTLGLFNISRFSILTIHYGGNFLLQFLLLSIIFGIPMLWLQMCLGAKIKSGPVSMWKISPICKGIGISLIVAQCVIALYSTISLGWVMVYFRDSFISRNEYYRWQEPFSVYRRSGNGTGENNLTETVADYFNGMVLQRWQLGLSRRGDAGGVRFQLAFNLAVIWTVVFVVLCKGLKSFGKIVLGLTLIPLMLFIVVTCKLLYIIDFSSVQNIFLASDFEDFLINSKTWTAAAQETFLTWTLLGPSVIAISSKSAEKTEGKTILRRDAVLVVIMTLFGLSMAAIFGFACVQILQNNDYLYIPGSYEYLDTYTFIYSLHGPISPNLLSIPIKWTPHFSTVLGETYRRTTSATFRESGYQSLRLVTELFPATIAVATQESISSVWSIMTFLMFLMFGIGQLCAMWKPISSALGDSTSSVLLSCVTGLLLGIPFATEMGLSIIHYLDTVLGGAWWILVLWSAQILAVFLIRGRPYNGDDLVKDLRMSGSMSAFLALTWNVLLPAGLITLAIIEYKISLASQFFHWRGKSYFHLWTRKVAGLIQISFLMVIPITAIIQIYRYLSKGPPDILDRIQLLYRPLESSQSLRRTHCNPSDRSPPAQSTATGVTLTNLSSTTVIHDDAPPKYTPPPSYTTATGARIAKLLRQSIRRSVRRILGEPSHHRPSLPSASNISSSTVHHNACLPPEYSTILCNPSGAIDLEIGSRSLYNSRQSPIIRPSSETSTRTRNRSSPSYTAFDVAQILRSSNRHERSASAITAGIDHVLRSSSLRNNKTSRSAENLVLNAAPLGESNAIVLDTTSITNETEILENSSGSGNSNNENTSVI